MVALLALAAPLAAEAQRARAPRVGILSPGAPGASPLPGAFQRGLRDLGYIEDQNIVLEYRFAATQLERLPALAAELVERRVDVIFAINLTLAQAAVNATKTIPIVFTWVADPAALVKNLGRPDGNVTGLSSFATELSRKRLELPKAAVPGVSRVAVLWNSANPVAASHRCSGASIT
jgi:putative tryptophan/tyrosine transport system substrate-binding protein